jgi:plastocyanin
LDGNSGCVPGRNGAITVIGSYKGFFPSALNITVGQTVTFTMGPMAFTCAFDKTGKYVYHCTDHPFMVVTVIVKE